MKDGLWHFFILGVALHFTWVLVFSSVAVLLGKRQGVYWSNIAIPIGLWLWFLWLRGVLP